MTGTLAANTTLTVPDLFSAAFDVTIAFSTVGTPYLRLGVSVPSTSAISLPNSLGSFYGSFALSRSGGTTVIALSNITASISNDDDPIALSNGQGALLSNADGVAGFLSGTATIAGSQVTVSARLNTTGTTVDETIDVAGTPTRIFFGTGEGNFFSAAASGAFDFGPVSIEGDVVLTHRLDGKAVFAGTHLTVFFGQGPLTLGSGERNPLARGLLISDATVGLVGSADTMAIDIKGTVSLIGVAGVDISGLMHFRYNDIPGTTNETLTTASGGQVLVHFDSTDSDLGTASATGIVVDVSGQRFTGDLTITKTVTGLRIGVENLAASLSAGGTTFATLTGGHGTLTTSATGVQTTTNDGSALDSIGGTLALTLPGATLSSTFDLTLDTTTPAPTFTFAATGVDLTVGGVKLSGGFSFGRTLVGDAAVYRLTVTAASLTFATTGSPLSLSGVNGDLTFSAAGLAGSLSGTVSSVTGGFGLTGLVGVTLDTAAGAFAVTGTGVTLTVGSGPSAPTMRADVSVTRSVGEDGSVQLTVAITHLTFAVTGASLTEGTGTVTVSSAGFVGSLSGAIALDVPGVVFHGALAVDVDTTAATPYVRFAGTGLSLDVYGQTLSGDVTITKGASGSTITVTHARASRSAVASSP